jgi:hypothetical protein
MGLSSCQWHFTTENVLVSALVLTAEQSCARLATVALSCICIGGCSCLLEGASEVGALNVILYVHAEQQVFKDFVVFASIAVAVKGRGGWGGGLIWYNGG